MILASSRDRIKAKLVAIGRPGSEIKFVAPKAKPIIEIHWWVLAYKLKTALGLGGLLLLGAGLSFLGWPWLWAGVGLAITLAFLISRPCP